MTWIFFSPAPVRTTSNALCSSAASPSPPPPAAGAAAATAVADTPNSSSSALMRSASSSTEMPLSSSIHSCGGGHASSFASAASSSAAARGVRLVVGIWCSLGSAGPPAPPRLGGPRPRPPGASLRRLGLGRRASGGRGLRRRRGPGRAICPQLDGEPADRARSARAPGRSAAPRPCRRAVRTARRGDGRRAIDLISSTDSTAPSITPPLNSRMLLALVKSAMRLGRDGGVAAHERQRGRAVEQRLAALSTPAWSAARSVSVFLTIRKRRVGLAQRRAQLRRLGHGDPAVVHGEDRRATP